eukprot:gene9883-2205_t
MGFFVLSDLLISLTLLFNAGNNTLIKIFIKSLGAILNFKFGSNQVLPLDDAPQEIKPTGIKSVLNDLKTLRVFIALDLMIFHIANKNYSALSGEEFDYLKDEIAMNIFERIDFIQRKFPNTLELNGGKGYITKKLINNFGIENYYFSEDSDNLLNLMKEENVIKIKSSDENIPFKEKSMNLIVCGNGIHWINDIPNTFNQIRKILKSDGVFIGCLFGGDTLSELRRCFMIAEQEREGGVSAHVSPMIGVRDVGNLLSQSGFNLPTIDSDVMTVYYPNALTLMHHLQEMGENSSLVLKRNLLSPETFIATCSIYDKMFGTEKGIPVTFEMIHFIAWSPDASQPKPAKRGSATVSMKDLAKEFNTTVNIIKDE